MNSLTRIMSYDKTKIKNQECNCDECISVENTELKNQTVEYPKLSEEEIEQIIKERYSNKDEKTKIFIRKALRKNGDRYDYSNVTYVKATVNVEIICRVEGHEPFPQTPNNHLSNRGCPMCRYIKLSNKRKLKLKEFIEKANEVHGVERYNYSKVNYVNMNTNVIIICPNHEEPYEFKQTPNNHLRGQGCPLCGINKLKLTLDEFIEKANEIHGVGRYYYSKVKYVNNYTEVIIICPNHKIPYEFKQTPNSHMNGRGCNLCGGNKKLTLEEFIKKANKVQGLGRYDYSKVNYINNSTNVIIICHNHDEPYEFEQTPNNHLSGKGCSKCSNNYKGEIAIGNFLTEYKIEFEEQKRFNDCKDSNTLPFDFYLPRYNLCIEFDGIQHFEPIKRSKTMSDKQAEKNLKYTQNHDKIKTEYCKNNRINLLRIRYDENIEEKLMDYFKI